MIDSQKLASYLEISGNTFVHCNEEEKKYIVEAVRNYDRLRKIEIKYINIVMNYKEFEL